MRTGAAEDSHGEEGDSAATGHGKMMPPADVTLLEDDLLQRFLRILGHTEKAEFRPLIVRPDVQFFPGFA